MASGDAVFRSGTKVNNWAQDAKRARVEKYLLLDEETSTANGVWIPVTGMEAAGIKVFGTGSPDATVQIRGEIETDGLAPANSDHGFQIGGNVVLSDTTEADFAPLSSSGQTVEWVKARISSYTDGTISAVIIVRY